MLGECRKALAWIGADASRRKTARGMKRFLVGWLGRAQNSGRARGPVPAPPRSNNTGSQTAAIDYEALEAAFPGQFAAKAAAQRAARKDGV